MKLPLSHNPQTKGYVVYYTVVLAAASGTVVFISLQFLQQSPIQSIMVFFEGYFSLFMLTRNKQVASQFLKHLSSLAKAAKI
ncbi:MAG TPA: hypothetical protein VJ792_05255 [Candidatus Nitrosotalea sp.]|nr:hypothetical protein [Candidatus Nitrosotalea sp.]